MLFSYDVHYFKVERDPTPLYHAAKELMNMQLETGEFPQQVCIQNLGMHKYYTISVVYFFIEIKL